uniref:Uncharacterized protein n=1 Tax=Moniliophthora roreri TaxID=221103 RepID=A0A0W0FA46_MONRR
MQSNGYDSDENTTMVNDEYGLEPPSSQTPQSSSEYSLISAYVLRNTPPEHTIARLVEGLRLHTLSEEVDRAIQQLNDNRKKHCVRCHQQFFEIDNGDDACRKDHEPTPARSSHNNQLIFLCCGCSHPRSRYDLLDRMHKTRHTSQSQGVRYYGGEGLVQPCHLRNGECDVEPIDWSLREGEVTKLTWDRVSTQIED